MGMARGRAFAFATHLGFRGARARRTTGAVMIRLGAIWPPASCRASTWSRPLSVAGARELNTAV